MPYASFCNLAAMSGGVTCFWWQLTHNITVHIIRLFLKKSCLKINVKKIPTSAGCHLATHPNPGLVETGESVCWYSFCVSWRPLNTHQAFAFFSGGDMVFVMVRRTVKTRNERDRHQGMERHASKERACDEFNCEMSSGHFVMRYRFRKILIRVCEWSQGNEENEWSLMFLKILKNMCGWSHSYDESE